MPAEFRPSQALRLWHDQALYKEPGGRGTDAHHDQPYWPLEQANTITAWIASKYGIPGDRYLEFAILRGDPSDGLPGVRGIGEKTASQLIAAHGGLCQLHCENGDVISWLEDRALAEGRVKPTDFPATCPDWTEEEAINRAILIGKLTGCPVYVVHLSTRLGLERLR